MPSEVPPLHDPHVRHLRRMFLAVVTGSFLFLIPWIGYLSVSLPTHREVDQWRLAWVGFDGALIAAIGITALCAWRRLQIFVPWAMVTATLLCCDAWFDIVLDWNSDELTGAVLTAAFAELPLAALLLYVARRMIRLTVVIAWRRAGRTGPVPPLSRLSLIVLTDEEHRARTRAGGPEDRACGAQAQPGQETSTQAGHGRCPGCAGAAPAPGTPSAPAPGPAAAPEPASTTETEPPDDHRHRPPGRAS
jgi:hypothetical protein